MADSRAYVLLPQDGGPDRSIVVGLRLDEAGVFRVGASRVTLDTLIEAYWDGLSVDEFTLKFPSVEVRDVHAALAAYLSAREYFDGYLARRRAESDADANRIEKDGQNLRERLLARRQGR